MNRWICILAIVSVMVGGTLFATPALAADAGGGGPLVAKPDLAIFTLVVFVVLLLVLWKFAWGPISAGLDKREQGVANNIARAEEAASEAEKLIANYEAKLAAASDEVRGMIEEARRDAEHTKQQIVDEAQQAASAEADRARREIETAKASALKELADRTTDFSLELAGQVLGREMSSEDHAQLIRRATDDFMKVDPSNN